MNVKHGRPPALRKEILELLRIKFGGEYVDRFITAKKEYREENLTQNYRKKWK